MNNVQDCLDQSGLKKEDIYSVEIVGGSSRIPCVKTLIEKVAKSPAQQHVDIQMNFDSVFRIRVS